MDVASRRLIGVPVRTKSGQSLGKVAELYMDTLTGRLSFVDVRTGGLLSVPVPGFRGDLLHIAWSQVLSVTEKEVVVVDSTVPAKEFSIAVPSEYGA